MGFFFGSESGHGHGDTMKWLLEAFGGGSRTRAGIRINSESTMSIAACFRAVDNMASHVAMLPFPTFKRGTDAKGREIRDRLIDDPLDDLLNLRANRETRALDFKRTLILHRLIWGNGYAERVTGTNGSTVAAWNLEPWKVDIQRRANDEAYYVYRDRPGQPQELEIEEVLHIAGIGNDGLMGYCVHRLAKENLGLMLAIERFAQTFFGNGGMPRIVFETSGRFGKDEDKKRAFAKSFDKAYGGDNANSSAVLENGVTAKALSFDNEKSQMLESRQFNVKDVARWMNMPPHLLFELGEATYNNISQMTQGYVIFCMQPLISEIEQEFIYKMIPKEERRTKFVEINKDALLRGDTKTRYECHKLAIEGGWRSRNEIRQVENLNPVDGLDEFLQPLNHTQASQQSPPAKNNSMPSATSLVPVFAKSIDSNLANWKAIIKKAAAKKGESFDDEDFASKITVQVWPFVTCFSEGLKHHRLNISDAAVGDAAKTIGVHYVALARQTRDLSTEAVISHALSALMNTGVSNEQDDRSAA